MVRLEVAPTKLRLEHLYYTLVLYTCTLLHKYAANQSQARHKMFAGKCGAEKNVEALANMANKHPPPIQTAFPVVFDALCTSFKRASDELCHQLAMVARRLCTSYVAPPPDCPFPGMSTHCTRYNATLSYDIQEASPTGSCRTLS